MTWEDIKRWTENRKKMLVYFSCFLREDDCWSGLKHNLWWAYWNMSYMDCASTLFSCILCAEYGYTSIHLRKAGFFPFRMNDLFRETLYRHGVKLLLGGGSREKTALLPQLWTTHHHCKLTWAEVWMITKCRQCFEGIPGLYMRCSGGVAHLSLMKLTGQGTRLNSWAGGVEADHLWIFRKNGIYRKISCEEYNSQQ